MKIKYISDELGGKNSLPLAVGVEYYPTCVYCLDRPTRLVSIRIRGRTVEAPEIVTVTGAPICERHFKENLELISASKEYVEKEIRS